MLLEILTVVFFALGLPVVAIAWLAVDRSRTRTQLLVKTLAGGSVVAALYFGMTWSVAMTPLRYVFAAAFLLATALAWRRGKGLAWSRPSGVGPWVSVAVSVLLFLGFGYLLTDMTAAGRIPGSAVELEFPFAEGTFAVTHGGSRTTLNYHVSALQIPRFRSLAYSLDIVQLNRLGRQTTPVVPRDLADFVIFGTPVVAPCAGVVHRARGELPDHRPPERETELANGPGNYVQIACDGGFHVVLAHLKQHSLTVAAGDTVAVGSPLGVIGNSGNSDGPHLHINAQAGPGDEYLLEVDPLPIIFRGHGFLLRNDVVRVGRRTS